VATHNDGYYDVLKQSVQRLGLDLETEGWSQPYQGFAWVRELLRDKINGIASSSPREILLLVDGFDVFIHCSSEEHIIQAFSQYQTPIVIAAEGRSVWYQDLLSRNIFGPCLGSYLNSGCIIGYAAELRTLYEYWYQGSVSKTDNDQLMLSVACRHNEEWFRQNVIIDTEQRIFATFPCALVPKHNLAQIIKERGSLIVHGNGDCDMDQLITDNGLDLAKARKRPNYMLKYVPHYAYFYRYHIMMLTICLLLIVFLISRLCG